MNEKVRAVLNSIVDQFKSGNIPASVAFSQYPAPKNIPLHSWSFLNRTICFFSGTMDARGFRQWQKANRKVKKGAKAIYILAPMFFKKEEEGKEKQVLAGFKPVPVFRAEDTEGDPLDYEVIELPDLPLLESSRTVGDHSQERSRQLSILRILFRPAQRDRVGHQRGMCVFP